MKYTTIYTQFFTATNHGTGNRRALSSLPKKLQKLEYIHENPVAAGLVNFAEEYKYSSSTFYNDEQTNLI